VLPADPEFDVIFRQSFAVSSGAENNGGTTADFDFKGALGARCAFASTNS
jgi:hypothetical protein